MKYSKKECMAFAEEHLENVHRVFVTEDGNVFHDGNLAASHAIGNDPDKEPILMYEVKKGETPEVLTEDEPIKKEPVNFHSNPGKKRK